jgi:cytochrome oxidase assembly protein ShyY1
VDWRFVRTPKWIVRHVLVVVLVVVMVNLGFWQLRRLDEKQAFKALVEARQEEPVVEARDLLAGIGGPDAPAVDEVVQRTVRADGTYLDDGTVVVENRTLDGLPGGWVLTPLDVGGGVALLVNRGFVGLDGQGRIVAPPAPSGQVEVEGIVQPTQERGSFGARDPEGGRLEVVARVDLARIDAQLDADLLPAYVQVVESRPPEPRAPEGEAQVVPLGVPEPSEGPHLAYAVQWFIFSTIAGGGYVLLLRKVAQDQAREAVAP